MKEVQEWIEELAKLLVEQDRVNRRVGEAAVRLGTVKKGISESLAERYIVEGEGRFDPMEEVMQEERTYERLLEALTSMKSEIENKIRPVEEEIVKANVNYIKQNFENGTRQLQECVGAIKQRIQDCRLHIDEYGRIRSELESLNESLGRLGAERLPVPDFVPAIDLESIISRCIEELRLEGKL